MSLSFFLFNTLLFLTQSDAIALNLLSPANKFELGFFPADNTTSNIYLGIWYRNISPITVVWVANRERPLSTSCTPPFFPIANGNLNLWCNKTLTIANPNNTLHLLDSGNLIVSYGKSGATLWESFQNPTDTLLPGMKMDSNMELISWISSNNPGIGDYTFGLREQGVYQIQNRSVVYWKSREAGMASISDKVSEIATVIQIMGDVDWANAESAAVIFNRNRTISFRNYTRLPFDSNYSRLVMHSSGKIQFYVYRDGNWQSGSSQPVDSCSVNDVCGKFEICDRRQQQALCQCLPGFQKSSLGSGCERKPLPCGGYVKERFEKLGMTLGGEVVAFEKAKQEQDCKEECLRNCKCDAYFYKADLSRRDIDGVATRCWIWSDIVNLRRDYRTDALNISVRVPSMFQNSGNGGRPLEQSENESSRISYYIVFGAVVMVVFFLIFIFCGRRMCKWTEGNQSQDIEATPMLISDENVNSMTLKEGDNSIDVPFYNLHTILAATNNFSNANKLGRGGFGPVYKGIFAGGQELAVKRLLNCTGQGVLEFINEVTLIAKLQHRNLVRLFGYCIQKNEKILLYEYMPNRSLDAFIFDQDNSALLNWNKRFDIILGVARGLMYLHHDSRLRIIHRDMKTSNILLDEEMNPKISDFGLARIVQGKRIESSTEKVMGTYGYMSPEYALDGKFSTKSDVFSFGVVILEIISGKKNTGFYHSHEALNLLGHAWRLWSDHKALDLVDSSISKSCNKSQVIKCIKIGLLCVQEDPNDRPSMSSIIIMLGGETSLLPPPTEPAFVPRRRVSSISSSSSSKPDTISNNFSITMQEGR